MARLINPKSDSPVAGDGQAPRPTPITRKHVRFPRRDAKKLRGIIHGNEEGDNRADLPNNRSGQLRGIVPLNEAPQSLVDHVANLHTKAYQSECGAVKLCFTHFEIGL